MKRMVALELINDIDEQIESKVKGLMTNLQLYLSSIEIDHDQHPRLKEIFERGKSVTWVQSTG